MPAVHHTYRPLISVRTWTVYGIVATCGIIITSILLPPSRHVFRLINPLQPQCPALPFEPKSVVKEGCTRPGLGEYVASDGDGWSLESLHGMVSRTKGYYARDYSVWLGWNNMRYIIETATLHANLLNRTLVVPSYVYARSCELKILCGVCDNGDQFYGGWPCAANRPTSVRQVWKVPIQLMMDFDALRKYVPVVTVMEYLQLHGLPETLEVGNGHWNLQAYHSNSSATSPSLAVIPNYDYDRNLSIPRVDRLPERQIKLPETESPEWGVYQGLLERIGFQATLNAEVAREFVKQNTGEEWQDVPGMVEIASKYGFSVVYTYDGQPSVFSKAVNNPVVELVPAATMKGFIDDYSHYTEDVLFLQGEIHGDRKPGSMTFTSPAGRDNHANIVLRGFNHLPFIQHLADAIAVYMRELNGGRMWMAAHWRRGDFVKLGWNKGSATEAIDHILSRFKEGTERLRRFRDEGFRPPTTSGVKLDQSFENASLPLPGDRWYVATDERDPKVLAIARAKNATLFHDIVDSSPQLRRLLGWPMLITDVVALVEQEVMARSAFFSAYAHSSVAGGVVNLRTVRGMDPRTMILDTI